MLHDATGGRSSAALHAAYRALPGWADAIPSGSSTEHRRLRADECAELDRRGIAMLPPLLTAEQVVSLRHFAETAPGRCVAGDVRALGTLRDHPEGTSGIFVDGAFAWARPEIQSALAHPILRELVGDCFRAGAIVHPPQLTWSLPIPGDDATLERRSLARRFHADFDGLRALRIHLYLTDVDEGTAPMQYVAGSHRTGAIPARLRRRHGDDVPEEVVTERFGAEALVTVTGPAGTTFASVSQGLHRATRARTGARLFLVIPVQAGSLAGAYSRRRAVPVTDEGFGAALSSGDPALRLFEPGQRSRTGPPVATLLRA